MAQSAAGKAGKVFVWILLGLLIIGLAGFGIGSFGGSATSIGQVGNRDITAQEYFRALNQAVRAQQAETGSALTLPQANAIGLPVAVRGQLVGAAALDNETARIGLSVGDEAVSEQVLTQRAFQGIDGQFDRDSYTFALRQNGWTVTEFEDSIRAEISRNILQTAVVAGVEAPQALTDLLMTYFGERRTLSWVSFPANELTEPLPEPSDADLAEFHSANAAQFTLPTTKRITYALITPDDVLDEVQVNETALRQMYDQRIAEFVQPERRLVERLVFADRTSADAAAAAIEAGETDFPTQVEERGLALADVDLGIVSRNDLPGDAADAVFALTEPSVVGPFDSNLGPALYRMNGMLAASEVSFEDARAELSRELGLDSARRLLTDMITDLDDRLAAGATVEDLAAETEMTLGTIEWHPAVTEGPAAYEDFRAAADAIGSDDFPEIADLEDGSLFAMRLDEILDPRLQSLDEVRADVRTAWLADQTLAQLRALAESANAQLAVGGNLGDDGRPVETAEGVTREGFVNGLPVTAISQAFDMSAGDTAIVDGSEQVVLMRLDSIAPPNEEDAQQRLARQAVGLQNSQGLSNDMLQFFVQALTADAGISFNDAGLNAVHSQVFGGPGTSR